MLQIGGGSRGPAGRVRFTGGQLTRLQRMLPDSSQLLVLAMVVVLYAPIVAAEASRVYWSVPIQIDAKTIPSRIFISPEFEEISTPFARLPAVQGEAPENAVALLLTNIAARDAEAAAPMFVKNAFKTKQELAAYVSQFADSLPDLERTRVLWRIVTGRAALVVLEMPGPAENGGGLRFFHMEEDKHGWRYDPRRRFGPVESLIALAATAARQHPTEYRRYRRDEVVNIVGGRPVEIDLANVGFDIPARVILRAVPGQPFPHHNPSARFWRASYAEWRNKGVTAFARRLTPRGRKRIERSAAAAVGLNGAALSRPLPSQSSLRGLIEAADNLTIILYADPSASSEAKEVVRSDYVLRTPHGYRLANFNHDIPLDRLLESPGFVKAMIDPSSASPYRGRTD